MRWMRSSSRWRDSSGSASLQDIKYEELDEREFVPAAAQAALAIEALAGRKHLRFR